MPARPATRSREWAAERSFELLSLGTFVALGLPDGMLGAAWPSMRESLGAPLADLGLVLLAATAGGATTSSLVGWLLRRVGAPAVLGAATTLAAVMALGFALAPRLWVLLVPAIGFGAAAGLIDGGLNTAIALAGRARLLNLLHGCYGVGTAIGPVIVAAAVLAGSWRPAYLVLLVVDLVAAVSWWRHRRSRPAPPGADARAGTETTDTGTDAGTDATRTRADGSPPPRLRATDRSPAPLGAIGLGLIVFFVYTGLEVSAGQWEASFARGALGMSAAGAGVATFGYWGALTAARLLLAVPRRPPAPVWVIRVGGIVALVGAAGVWWHPDVPVTIAAFAVIGAALAGVFPALVAVTPGRLGSAWAERAVGWQVGAAGVGGSALSAVVGVVLQSQGLTSLGPTLIVMAAALLLCVAALDVLAPTRAAPATT